MPSPIQPEFFALLGINLFLATSLLTCLLDRHFPWQLPYVYQLAALVGFGQLLVSKEFIVLFGEYTRFWYSLIYQIVALANIVAVNAYLGIVKKLLNYSRVLTLTVTLPALSLTALFLSTYAEVAVHPLLMVPQVSLEAAFTAIASFYTFVVGASLGVFFLSNYAVAMRSLLMVPEMSRGDTFTAIAFYTIVVGVGVCVFARILRDKLKKKTEVK